MMKVYKIKTPPELRGLKTNVIFLRMNFLGDNQPIDSDGDMIYEEPHLTFGTKQYTSKHRSNFNGCIKHWNLAYNYLDIVKNENILIKDCEYDISTFQKLYDLLVKSASEGVLFVDRPIRTISRFYESLCTKYNHIEQSSNILIFRATTKEVHRTNAGDLVYLNIVFKNNFTTLSLPRHIYNILNLYFSPKDLKIKR